MFSPRDRRIAMAVRLIPRAAFRTVVLDAARHNSVLRLDRGDLATRFRPVSSRLVRLTWSSSTDPPFRTA
jgi:hypothetical protein